MYVPDLLSCVVINIGEEQSINCDNFLSNPIAGLLEGSCLIYVICVCLRIVVSNTYSAVFLFCLSSSMLPVSLDCQF